MNKFMIVTDSCSDIRGEDIKKYDVEVIPMNLSFGDEQYQEGVNITIDEFYEKLTKSKNFPKTSQASPEMFINVFNKAKELNQEVLVLVISSGLSGTMQSAKIAANITEYEDHIHIVDTLACLTGLRLLVTQASKMRSEGKSIDEVIETIEDIKHRVRYLSVVDTLEFLHKGGRLSKTGMIIGSLMGIKPFIDLDSNGKIRKFGHSIGLSRAIKNMCEYIKKNEIDDNYGVFYSYTTNKENLDRYIDKTFGLFNKDSYDVSQIGAVSGAHIGPGAFCVSYISKNTELIK